jgi:uncharacterized protein with HEPN domain
LGEVLHQLSRPSATTASLLPDMPCIVAFRNLLTHRRASVDNRIAWGVRETTVPLLVGATNRLLAQHTQL